jgi:hypothetical protein
VTENSLVSLILGGLGFLFGGGTICSALVLAYRIGGWRKEVTQLRSDLNGPFHDKIDTAIKQFKEKSDSTAKHTQEAIDLALEVQRMFSAKLPECAVNRRDIETQRLDLDKLSDSVQKVMDRQQRKSEK